MKSPGPYVFTDEFHGICKEKTNKQTKNNNKETKTHLYAAYKRLTLALRVHIGSKCKDRKKLSMQMQTKRE